MDDPVLCLGRLAGGDSRTPRSRLSASLRNPAVMQTLGQRLVPLPHLRVLTMLQMGLGMVM